MINEATQHITVQPPQAGSAPYPPALRPLLEDVFARTRLLWCYCTRTRADTGRWWVRPRLWLLVCDASLVLAAPGPRPMVRHWTRQQLQGTTYNHVTGRLLLAGLPTHAWENAEPVATLAIGPIEAQRVLHWLQTKETQDA